MTHITADVLVARGATTGCVARFRRRFPAGVEVTPELCVAEARDWNWSWAIHVLLTDAGRRTVCPAFRGRAHRDGSWHCRCERRGYDDPDVGQVRLAHAFAHAVTRHGLSDLLEDLLNGGR